LRPPWAIAEPAFLDCCTRCNACIEACSTDIVVSGDGGYPEVDFARGECTFCGDCVRACREGALRRSGTAAPWNTKAEIGAACLALKQVECRVCGESCPSGAIRFRPQARGVAAPLLDAQRCNGCGACVATCPAAAITVRAPLPEITA
jgi:ferredoxin-type protein NapF